MNIDIKKIGELNEAIYNDNLLFLVEDQDGKGKKLKGANFREELKSDLVAKSDVLSLEEIQASTDTTNKVASADSVKQLDNNKLNKFRIGNSNGVFATIGNIGGNAKDITIQLTDVEQTVFIFGNGNSTSNYMTMLIGGSSLEYSFGKDNLVSKSRNDKTIIVTLPSWFRGCFFSYLPFTIIEN